ncbi:hypothetical protein F6P62_05090 [Streptococcus suis]|nr:hypothetical protein [Streptococcus suis]
MKTWFNKFLQIFDFCSPNQVLRKLVKLVNLVNVNYQRYINVSKHSRVYLMGAFFVVSTGMDSIYF